VGGSGDDFIVGGSAGNNTLIGGNGNDVLVASLAGNDSLDPDYAQTGGDDTYVVPGNGWLEKAYEFRIVHRDNGSVVRVREDNKGQDQLFYGVGNLFMGTGQRDDMDDSFSFFIGMSNNNGNLNFSVSLSVPGFSFTISTEDVSSVLDYLRQFGSANPGNSDQATPSLTDWLHDPTRVSSTLTDRTIPDPGPAGTATPDLSLSPGAVGYSWNASGNPYYLQFLLAAQTAGVPESWASDPALLSLVAHESGWNRLSQNPDSSAFGLFQVIDRTWAEMGLAKTSDPYFQAVAGFRYIERYYGTPERAWAFWQATVQKNPALAPPDLQDKARTWISNNWGGY
jgi:hypothetical protein